MEEMGSITGGWFSQCECFKIYENSVKHEGGHVYMCMGGCFGASNLMGCGVGCIEYMCGCEGGCACVVLCTMNNGDVACILKTPTCH